MNVKIDDESGFCFGVVRAISEAEQALADSRGTVFCLGDIVHNRVEVQRLEELGLRTISREQMSLAAGCRMIIRAHGEPPATYSAARRLGIEVVDATCPVVAKLQERVKAAHRTMQDVGGQVVILGKHGHAEVVGLTGQVGTPTIVVENEQEIEQIDFSRPLIFLSQTTQSITLFNHLAQIIRRRMTCGAEAVVVDTICRRVSSREQHLQQFAAQQDVVVFVCGRKSSNGRVLYDICRGVNIATYNIEEPSELQKDWFEGAQSVGVCGATSTPKWLMQRVADEIGRIIK